MVEDRNIYGFYVDRFNDVSVQTCGSHSWFIIDGLVLEITQQLVDNFKELEYGFADLSKKSSNKVFTGELFVW